MSREVAGDLVRPNLKAGPSEAPPQSASRSRRCGARDARCASGRGRAARIASTARGRSCRPQKPCQLAHRCLQVGLERGLRSCVKPFAIAEPQINVRQPRESGHAGGRVWHSQPRLLSADDKRRMVATMLSKAIVMLGSPPNACAMIGHLTRAALSRVVPHYQKVVVSIGGIQHGRGRATRHHERSWEGGGTPRCTPRSCPRSLTGDVAHRDKVLLLHQHVKVEYALSVEAKRWSTAR